MKSDECPCCGAYVYNLYCEFCGERVGPRRGAGPETRVQALERAVRRLEDCLSTMAEKSRRQGNGLVSGRTPKPAPLPKARPARSRAGSAALVVTGLLILAGGLSSLRDLLPADEEQAVVESSWGGYALPPAAGGSPLPTARRARLRVLQASAAAPGIPVSVVGSARSAVSEQDKRAAIGHWHNGIIFFQRGDYAQARDEWLLCKAFDPGSDDCSAGLARIDSSYSP